MLTIGMLGGMSWESTAEYYRLANELVAQRLGGLHSARLLLASVDFAEIAQLQHDGAWDRAGELLAAEAKALQAGGADLVVLCTNTMHLVADAITAAVTSRCCTSPMSTAAAVRAAGLRRVGLLATAFTMEEAVLRDHLPRAASPRSSPTRPTARASTRSSTTSCASASSGRSPGRPIAG